MEKGLEKVEVFNGMPEPWRELRERVLLLENKTDGLNIERVKDFFAERNLPMKDFLVFDEEDLPRIKEILGASGLLRNIFDKDERATYLAEIDLVLVRRNRNDKNSDPVFTEGSLVHELAHASGQYVQYAMNDKGSVWRPRVGFALTRQKKTPIPAWGWLLEEGFADLVRGEYEEKNLNSEIKKDLMVRRKKPDFPLEKEIVFAMTASGRHFGVFGKYLYPLGEADTGFTSSAIAATSLELLCQKHPDLRETLIAARTDIEKLREIPKLINEIKPGLYTEIQKCAYTVEDFARVQNIIREAVSS